MNNTPFQRLYCRWNSFQIWGLVQGEETVHLSFDHERHMETCGARTLAAVGKVRQKTMCSFLLSTLQGAANAFPKETPFIRQGTPFQQRVWRALCRIPFATTRTYGEIACELGNPHLARAVGQACNRNPLPLIIPCHRVVSSKGLGGFAGGGEVKKALLDYEQAWVKREVGNLRNLKG